MKTFISALWQDAPRLTATALACGQAAVLLAAVAPFDPRDVLGINPWIKPMKFLLSFTLYAGTLAWMLRQFALPVRLSRRFESAICVVIAIEMACLGWQAARATTSHFNLATSFDAALFNLMGIAIAGNTLLVAGLLVSTFNHSTRVGRVMAWGIRLGIIVFLLGSLEAVSMLINGGHTVGASDGGPGLPLLNWSTTSGDLRIAHFIGIHGLQAMPLVACCLCCHCPHLSENARMNGLWIACAGYVAVGLFTFLQAMAGRPLLAL